RSKTKQPASFIINKIKNSARGRFPDLSVKSMSPQLLFWIPAVLRLVLCLAGAGVVGFFFGPIIGLVTAVLGVGAMMITH
ncbi:hypothetical protein, partial [Escherichia coli]|uniref:hypothetical protein n=1 Tax=Escherichia coli TaxID=562 RepID=UPI0039E0E954